MSRMTDKIGQLAKEQIEVVLHIPARGYVLGKVESIEDDIVTIAPKEGQKVILHYTAFSVERD